MSTEPKVYPDPSPPDREAIIVRGVCGAVLGVGVAAGLWFKLGGRGPLEAVVLLTASIVVCAWGSIRRGDAFWTAVLRRKHS